MISLFSKNSLRILESLSFTQTIYAFDFDGTLAPIVDDPMRARMSAKTEKLLTDLSRKVPTAIISGRSLEDLRSRVRSPVSYLIGNHGLEGGPDSGNVSMSIEQVKALSAYWKISLQTLLKEPVREHGISVEDKVFSLSIHYRRSRQKKIARALILDAISQLDPLPRVIPGKLVFNIIPANGAHKGVALSRLVQFHQGAKFAFFIGDDDTDEDVFGLMDRRMLTVSVGPRKKSCAKYFIPSQKEIDTLLEYLVKFHE